MDLTKLLDWTYLFRAYTFDELSTPFRIALYGACILAIVAAVIAQRQLSKNSGAIKKWNKKIVSFGWTVGLVGLLFLLFRETRALYLGARLWLLLWLLGSLAWIIYLTIYKLTTIPKLQKEKIASAEFNKWLPKAKK